MKRILNKLFSKLVLGGLIIILQFSWFVYLLYSATVYSSMVDALFKIASIVLALFVSSRDMRSTYKTSWIFLILALPPSVGILRRAAGFHRRAFPHG